MKYIYGNAQANVTQSKKKMAEENGGRKWKLRPVKIDVPYRYGCHTVKQRSCSWA
jgi:hypothetical protein